MIGQRSFYVEAEEKKHIEASLRKHGASESSLIPVFQDIQKRRGFLSEEAVRAVARGIGIPASRAFSVAAFYGAFSLEPRGRNEIHVCTGTACHLKGADRLAGSIARKLAIVPGATTKDGRYSLHEVRCLGCCAIAPVVKVNDDIHPQAGQAGISEILEKYT